MSRTVYVLPTILGLLVAGPIHCASASGCIMDECAMELAECASQQSAGSPHGCGGCSHPGPQEDNRVQPAPAESAPTCTLDVCRGSLSEAPRRPVVEYRLLLALASVAVLPDAREGDAASEALAGIRPDALATRHATGRELCIAICSFLL